MTDQKVRELANDVHNVRCNESFRVFSVSFLAEVEKLLDDGAKELVLPLHMHAAANRAQGPAKLVKLVKVDIVLSASGLHLL